MSYLGDKGDVGVSVPTLIIGDFTSITSHQNVSIELLDALHPELALDGDFD